MTLFTQKTTKILVTCCFALLAISQSFGQITTNLASTSEFCQGTTATLSVVVTNATSYQWYKDGVAISGQNTNTFTKASTVLGDAGVYHVVVNGLFGTDSSVKNTMSIRQIVAITTQPTATQTLCEAGTLNLSVVATGFAPLTYVWKKGATVVGTNSSSFSIPSLAIADAGTYTVSITGSALCPTVTSSNAVVTVQAKPIITVQPAATTTICQGSTLNLSVTATGAAPITYVWKKGGSAISGAITSSYSKTNTTQAADAGTYTVEVKDNTVCAAVPSANAVVNINLKPVISAGPSGTTPLCVGGTLTLNATTSNNASVAWFLNGTQVSTSATYTKTATLSDAGNYTIKAIANTGCVDTTSAAYAVVVNTPPTITVQPTATQTLCEGNSLSLNVTATGTGPFTYQWKKGGTNVGTNSNSFSVSNITQAANAGTYTVEVTGASPCAAVTSANAVVNINLKPVISAGPSGTTPVCVGSTLTLNATTSNVSSTAWFLNGTQVGTGTTFTKTAALTDAGNYTVKAIANTGCVDTTSAAYAVTIQNNVQITAQPAATQTLCEGSAIVLSVTATGAAPLTYQWKKGATNIGSNLSSIVVANVAALTDAGTYSVSISDATTCPPVTSANSIVVISPKPIISAGPSGTPPFCVGSTLTLNSTVTNAANIVWFKNGTQVGTGATFTKTAALTDAGSYTVKAEGNVGCPDTTSAAYAVTINSPVAITVQPTATQTICEGNALNLTATVTGTAPIVYQWKKGATNIGTNSNAYTVASTTQAADAGTYSVEVSDASGCPNATSTNAVVNINLKPVISAGPSGTTPLCVGNTLTLNATTSNASSTVWLLNGTQVGTGATYTKTVAATDAGNYTVKAVANTGCVDTTSSAYAVVVNTPAAITVQPTATQTLCEGNALNLSVTATGTSPLTYQWKKGATNVGTNSNTYTVASTTQATDAGTYTVEITGVSPCTSVTSANAVVNINLKPVISAGPSGTTPLCVGNTLTLNATTSNASSTVWLLNGTQVGTGATYTKTAAAADAGNYTVKAVANTGCVDTTSSAYAVVVNTPAAITVQPTATQTLCEGNALNLSVTATGTTPLTYQWKKGATNVGTNSNTYTVASTTQAADAGTYTVEITGVSPCTSVTSANAVVNINLKPTLSTAANGTTNICLGDPLGINASASGATSVEWRKDGSILLTGAGPALNYLVNPTTNADSGKYYFVAQGSTPCNNVILDSITVKINQPIVFTTQPTPTQTLCEGNTLNLSVVATGQAPLSYVWYKNGSIIPGSTANFTKSGILRASDTGTYKVEVTGAAICPSVYSANAIVNINLKPSISPLPAGTTPLCVGNPISIASNATNIASVEWKKAGSVIATTATYTKAAASATDSGVYSFVAKALPGCLDSINTFSLVVNEPPTITVQPRDTTICEGKAFTLSVSATGTSPLSYQWKRDGTNIPITTNTFSVSNATQALAQGAYTVVVSGASPCNPATSSVANVVVNLKPIPTTPTGLSDLCIGDPINLSATASNISSIEWYRGTTLVGTGTSFSKAVSVIADSGNYLIKAKALTGCVDSNSLPLNVKLKTPATILTQPLATQTLCEGAKLSLKVVATSAGTLSYQWKKGGVDISGATNDSFIVTSTNQAADSGTYTCVVTSSGICVSTATSNNAVVLINKKPVISAGISGVNNLCLGNALSLTATTANMSSIEWKKGATVLGTTNPYTVASVAYTDSGNYTLVVKALPSCVDTTSAAYNVKINAPVNITTQPTVTQTLCEGNNLSLNVVATGQAPLSYVWKRNGTTVGSSLPGYNVTGVTQATDTGTYTVSITGAAVCPSVVSNNAVVIINKKPVITAGIAGNNTLCLGDSLGLTATAINISSLEWKKGSTTVATGSLFSKKPTVIADAASYNIVAKALPGCIDTISGTYSITINQPTSIFIPPVAQTKCEGDSLLVGVVANGTGPFSYAWRKDGVAISGAANAAIYRKGNITQADTGRYSVIVTGAAPCPSVLSDSGKVSINKKPTLTGIAGPNDICLGSALNLTTTYANGTDIEWYKDGVFQFNGFNSYQLFSATYPDSGNYTVKIKAFLGCVDTTTPNFVVKVKKPVTINTQPTATQTLCIGTSINLSVAATGEAPLTYVWRKNTTPIVGETNVTYTKANVAVTDSGNYTVIVTGSTACPSITSSIARVNVNPKPGITTQPTAVSTNICVGDSIRMSGVGTNFSSIEWKKNGVTVGTGTFYRKAVSTINDSGTYTMVVKGLSPCADTISTPVVININNPVVITTQPTATQTLCEGSPLKLKVVATGQGTLTYQWKKNTVNIGSATLDSFVKLATLLSVDTGNYTVAITGSAVCPTVTSAIGRVNINLQPKVTSQPAGVNNICLGDSIKLTAAAINTSAIEWRRNGTLVGSGAVYTKLVSTMADTGSYMIVAKGISPCMDSMSSTIAITINNPVVITTQPIATQTLCEGSPLKLKVVATGQGTLTYQWKKNTVNIGSATLDSFVKLVTLQSADTGDYTVSITGASVCPTVTSAIGRVNINLQPNVTMQPIGVNNICLGDSIKLTAAAINTSAIEWRRNGTLVGSGAVYTKLVSTIADTGNYMIVAKGISPCMDSMSSTIAMTINNPVVITTQPTVTQTLCEGNTIRLNVVATGSGSLAYQWKRNTVNIGTATLDSFVKFGVLQSADTGNYTVAITGAAVCPTVTSDIARVDINLKPIIASAPMGTNQVCLDSMINIVSNASNISGIEWFKNGVSVATTTDYNVPVAAYSDSATYTYKALALTACVDTLSDSFVVKVKTPLSIVTQPLATQTLCEGNKLMLKVVATGSGPYSYQWKLNGTDIAGATNDSFVKSNILVADAGTYTCMVSGSSVCYAITSASATVIINKSPVITQNPMTSSVLCAGSPLTLTSVSANKSQVEWFRDGVSVGTGDNYSVTSSSTANSGLYKFKLTALTSCVDIMSDTFRVFISNPVSISTQPTTTQTLCKGNSFNINVIATSNVPLTYQWKKDGNLLTGKTDSFLAISSLDITDIGTYTVDVKGSSSCPVSTSNNAVLNVNLPPVINTQPTGANPICEGSKIKLTALVDNYTSLEWRKGSNILVTSDSFVKLNATFADSGNYHFVVKALTGCRDTVSNMFTQNINKAAVITTNPISTKLVSGRQMSHVLRVGVSGTGPFTYQWYKNNVAIPGANADTFKIFDFTTVVDSGIYYVAVTGPSPCNSAINSNSASVYPTVCPIIVKKLPNSIFACRGEALNLEVFVKADILDSVKYQWIKGLAISGAVYPRYTVSNVSGVEDGHYLCKISYINDGICPPIYDSVNVSTVVAPQITTQPMPNKICSADTHTMSVLATDANIYQWFLNGDTIVGATSSTYTVAPLGSINANYTVKVTNPYCSPKTSTAVNVKKVNPSSQVVLNTVSNFDLVEQCTDTAGWSYYSTAAKTDEFLLAVRKKSNIMTLSPDIEVLSAVKEISPNNIENKGALFGSRLFNIDVVNGNVNSSTYDVKFYYSVSEYNTIVGRFNDIKSKLNDSFVTFRPINTPSFITSTQEPFTSTLLNNITMPANFFNTIVSLQETGTENNVNYVIIKDLVAKNGGGTLYFDYFKKVVSSSIVTPNSSSLNINLYPVPSMGDLTVEVNNPILKSMQISVLDMTGKVVYEEVVKHSTEISKHNLDLNHLSNGTYHVKVSNGEIENTSRFSIIK